MSKTKRENLDTYILKQRDTFDFNQFSVFFVPKIISKQRWYAWARPRGEEMDAYRLIGWFVGQMSRIRKHFRRYAEMQVSAKALVVVSKTRWKTSGYVRPEASIHERFWISFRFSMSKKVSKWQWSAWGRPNGKQGKTYALASQDEHGFRAR